MSFILLGILNSQAAAAGEAGAFHYLEGETLASSDASIEFTSLVSKYSSDYQHLQLRMIGRTDRASNGDSFKIQLNSDTGSNYSSGGMRGENSAQYSYNTGSVAYWDIGYAEAANNTAAAFSPCIVDILDPFDTNKYTTAMGKSALVSSIGRIVFNDGSWRSFNAVDNISISPLYGPNFVSGSRFSLYGFKSA